jgi:anaphase-promoting complex subunit 3
MRSRYVVSFVKQLPQLMCYIKPGAAPEIDEIFPPRPPPIKRTPPEDVQPKSVPVATGAGFFTPDAGNGGNLFRTWKPDITHPQPFRMAPPPGPRDSM